MTDARTDPEGLSTPVDDAPGAPDAPDAPAATTVDHPVADPDPDPMGPAPAGPAADPPDEASTTIADPLGPADHDPAAEFLAPGFVDPFGTLVPEGAPPAGDEPPAPGFWRRQGQRFLDMPLEGYVTLFIVAACVIFVFVQLHPAKIFSDTTPAGGDMGAHVWAPAYLRDHLLTKGRFSGWTPDWYAGFPAFQFYMIIPSLAIALLSLVIPYGIAFKIVAVSGCVSLPFSAYYFGRMARLPFPAPPLLAVAATLFLFDRSFSIYGGNIPSTLAGEFAFSISLSFALLYLGVLARGLETGKYRGWAALLLALTGLCHLIPFIFVLVCTVLWFVVRPGLGQVKYLITMGPVAALLVAFWMLPFYGRSGYMNDMGWEKIERYGDYLWNREKLDPQLVNVPDLKWVIALAAVGLLLSIVYRRRAGVFLALVAGAMALGFVYAPQGRLWNARLLPFYYLALYLLAAVGIAELGRLLSALFARDVNKPLRSLTIATPIIGCAAGLIMLAMSLQVMPFGKVQPDGSYAWGPLSTKDRSFVDSWADWNFDGYEGSTTNPTTGQVTYKKSYPEYYGIVTAMKQLGQTNGCGRAMWEHEEQHDRYGTPMALMLLPFWTDGCIGSMEGLYFEASTTTPYHFLNQDELSYGPSNAQRDLPYGAGPPTQEQFDLGVRHLQMMGVRYYMAINDATKVQAQKNPSLVQATQSGPWTVYEVQDAPLVRPLPYQPAVLTGQDTTHRPWQDTAVCWYVNQADWDVPLTADGPADWQRVSRTVQPAADATPAQQCQPAADWGWFDTTGGPELKAQKPITVSNVVTSDDTISFDVSEPGVPVMVAASYFPNWTATGADGPYRATPNFMVVVPTSNHVELHYGYTSLDLFAILLTLIGIAGLVYLFKAAPVRVKPPRAFWGKAERPDLYPPAGPDLRFTDVTFEQDQALALAAIVPEPFLGSDADALARRSPVDGMGQPVDATREGGWAGSYEPLADLPGADLRSFEPGGSGPDDPDAPVAVDPGPNDVPGAPRGIDPRSGDDAPVDAGPADPLTARRPAGSSDAAPPPAAPRQPPPPGARGPLTADDPTDLPATPPSAEPDA